MGKVSVFCHVSSSAITKSSCGIFRSQSSDTSSAGRREPRCFFKTSLGIRRLWQWNPMSRLYTPADVGNAVALLCAEEASFITGQTLYVDGGASVMFPEMPLPLQGL